MSEERRKALTQDQSAWPRSKGVDGVIDLHVLPSVATINGARINELAGEDVLPPDAQVILRTFRAAVGERSFRVGFCIGNATGFSAIGLAVIDRLMIDLPDEPLHVVPIVHEEIAWDIAVRHLRTFSGKALLFAFPNSDVYDAALAEVWSSTQVRQFDPTGAQFQRPTAAQRQKIREQKAAILNRPPPSKFYATVGVVGDDSPWIFRLATPSGKVVRTAVWDGRRDYAHEFPQDIVRWVGGSRIAIVQVDSPVGINLRSSLNLTHLLARDFDGIIHWARDTKTFQSILKSFIRLDLESAAPPALAEDWNPEIVVLAANT